MRVVLPFLGACTLLVGVACKDPPRTCFCDDRAVLTPLDGCDDFGGDEDECSGWESCQKENGLAVGASSTSGDQLTCFGCTIEITCP